MAPEAIPSTIAGRFEVVGRLEDRGLGESWHCRDPRRNNGPVMVKLLRLTGPVLPSALNNLLERTRHTRHEAVLRVYEWGVWEDRPFIVYEFFEGMSLGAGLDVARSTGELLTVGVLREAFEGVAAALDAAHRAPKELLHLGVDPSCVIMRRLPKQALKLKVLDFGLAPWADPDPTIPKRSARALRCAAPEAADLTRATPRSDVFALGALVREMFATPPDTGETLMPTSFERRRDDVPNEVWAEIVRATDLDATKRHATFGEFVEAMRAALSQPVKRPAPVRVQLAPVEAPQLPSFEEDPRTWARPVTPAVTPASLPVAGALPALARLSRSVSDSNQTISLVNAATRPAPSPWDLGALRDERAEAEHEAAEAWFQPKPADTADTFVSFRPGATPAPARVVDENATIQVMPSSVLIERRKAMARLSQSAAQAQSASPSSQTSPNTQSPAESDRSDIEVSVPTWIATPGSQPLFSPPHAPAPAPPQAPVPSPRAWSSWTIVAVVLGIGAALAVVLSRLLSRG